MCEVTQPAVTGGFFNCVKGLILIFFLVSMNPVRGSKAKLCVEYQRVVRILINLN